MSDLVLKIADPSTVKVPVICELFGDNDKVICTLKLKVTFEKTKPKDWEREVEEADASTEDSGRNIMLRKKTKDIEGLPLEQDGQPVPYSGEALDLILKNYPWIQIELWGALESINAGKRSDTFRRAMAKNL